MGLIEYYELEKEYTFTFEGRKENIEARIYRIIDSNINASYTWEINYYCRLDHESEPYSPGGPYAKTFEQCERKLMEYKERFETAVEVKLNKLYTADKKYFSKN